MSEPHPALDEVVDEFDEEDGIVIVEERGPGRGRLVPVEPRKAQGRPWPGLRRTATSLTCDARHFR